MIKYSREYLLGLRKQVATSEVLAKCKEAHILRYRGRKAGRKHPRGRASTQADVGVREDSWRGQVPDHDRCKTKERGQKVLLINARSLPAKIDELEWLLDIEKGTFAAITETWLTQEMPDHLVCPEGYDIHRSDRVARNGGGVCLLIRSNWESFIIKHDVRMPVWMESILVHARLPTMPRFCSAIIFLLVYIPPGATRGVVKEMQEKIVMVLDFTHTKYPDARTLLLGDFNQIRTFPITNPTGLKQIVKEPTRIRSILDLIMTDINDYRIKTLAPLGTSDHSVVSLEVFPNTFPSRKPKGIMRMTRPKPEHAINECGARLGAMDWSYLYEIPDIDTKYVKLKEVLYDVLEDHFPQVKRRVYPRSKPWMHRGIADMIQLRDAAFKTKDTIRFKELRQLVKEKIIEAKSRYYAGKVQNLRYAQPKEWHRRVKDFAGLGEDVRRGLKCDLQSLNEQFVSYGVERSVQEVGLKEVVSCPRLEDFEVAELLKRIPLSKSQPINDCSAFLLKQFYAELAEPVAHLFNFSLQHAVFPDDWTCIQVTPIPKITNPKTPNDYRPIGLLPVLMKVLEKYVTGIIRATKQGQTGSHQFGGKRGLSTCHYLVKLLEFIHGNVELLRPVRVAAIDAAKAYNSVNHDRLFEKLDDLDLHPVIYNWTVKVLCSIFQVVKCPVTNELSGRLPVKAGVPQGTAMAGELFIIYTDDVPQLELLCMFIDDMTTAAGEEDYTRTSVALQAQLDEMGRWLEENKLMANAAKSGAMLVQFTKGNRQDPGIMLRLEGEEIQQEDTLKILGVTLQNDLKFDVQVKMMVNKAKTRLYFLKRLATLGVRTEDLRLIYLNYVRPLMEYAAPIWTMTITKTQSDDIERIQKRALSIIQGKWSNTYEENLAELELDPLVKRREEAALKLAWRMYINPQFRPLFPRVRDEGYNLSTRDSKKLWVQHYRTARRARSPVPYFVRLLNASDLPVHDYPLGH